jgi:hypothetical protein
MCQVPLRWPLRLAFGVLVVFLVLPVVQTGGAALAQEQPAAPDATMDHSHPSGLIQANRQAPTLPGQDAFGAIQEIVLMLEADPGTDWSKVNLEALRQHLIDMNEVTLGADAEAQPVPDGLQISVRGSARTLEAIRRMVPSQAAELGRVEGWAAKAEVLTDGVLLTVTSADPKQVAHIRGLGFIGLMTTGGHHQLHHWAMAKGEMSVQ